MSALHINGNDLTLEAVREVAAERRPVLLAPDAREVVDRARSVVDALVAGNRVAYAITTGVGKLSDVHIAGDQIRELQVNLVRSHAVGVGEPLPVDRTRPDRGAQHSAYRQRFQVPPHTCRPLCRSHHTTYKLGAPQGRPTEEFRSPNV